MALQTRFTSATIESALSALTREGYEAAIRANDQGMGNQYIVVQDPFYHSHNGALVLMGYEPTMLRSYGQARKFISERA
jgi:hypothetical protein